MDVTAVMDHVLVGIDCYGERCSCGFSGRVLEHFAEVVLAEMKEAA